MNKAISNSMTILVMTVCFIACGTQQHDDPSHNGDRELATAIAHAIAAACPLGDDTSNEAARDECSNRLTGLAVLRDAMREPFIWGGQASGAGYQLAKGTNKFNARVWRRLYLSTFMFSANFTVESVAEQTIIHMPVTFRGAMSIGAYPYPFWHANGKWSSYNYSTTIHFIIQDGEVIGALRAAEQDAARPKVVHTWNGLWRWEQNGKRMPYVSLYDYLLSKDNPYIAKLDEAYRTLEARMRKNHCLVCHAPDNKGGSPQLEFFVYPSQALAGRHDIIAQLIDDQMPPENDLGITAGIADIAERDLLIKFAQDFEATGDAALTWEGDNKISSVR